jgi:hypothetical protein
MKCTLEFNLGGGWSPSNTFPGIYSSKKKALAETEPYATKHELSYRAVPVKGGKTTKKSAKKKGNRKK